MQQAFASVHAFGDVENASRLGHAEALSVRKSMWELLCTQVESGMGPPDEEQLATLWDKYDGNQDGELSSAEIRGMLMDYSTAMHARLSKAVPKLKRWLQLGALNGTLNPFVELVCRAFLYESEAQMALYRAQADGRITSEALTNVARQLDTNGDTHVTREEFMANATQTFFSSLLEEMTNEAMVASMSAAASDAADVRPSLVFQSLEKAEKEALMAKRSADNARKRLTQFTAYTKRLKEDQNKMADEIEAGAKTMMAWRERRGAELLHCVRRDGAGTLVALEMAMKGGSDEDAREHSVHLFSILSKQLVAGMGEPSHEQVRRAQMCSVARGIRSGLPLAPMPLIYGKCSLTHHPASLAATCALSPQLLALWVKYDTDGNGALSRSELAHLLADYAKARADEIEAEELPRIQKMMDAEGHNQFVLLLSRARIMAKEAELALFKAQAEGQIAPADLQTTFNKLDTDHDVSLHNACRQSLRGVFATLHSTRCSHHRCFRHSSLLGARPVPSAGMH